jgi:hypothetical protein
LPLSLCNSKNTLFLSPPLADSGYVFLSLKPRDPAVQTVQTATKTSPGGMNPAPYTRNFTITAYDGGSVASNPFGEDGTSAYYWAFGGKYGKMESSSWTIYY